MATAKVDIIITTATDRGQNEAHQQTVFFQLPGDRPLPAKGLGEYTVRELLEELDNRINDEDDYELED